MGACPEPCRRVPAELTRCQVITDTIYEFDAKSVNESIVFGRFLTPLRSPAGLDEPPRHRENQRGLPKKVVHRWD